MVGSDSLTRDLRYGARMLAKNPGFTTVAAITLALGIGANTTIFSLVNAVLLKPLPFREPGRLVMIWMSNELSGGELDLVSAPEFDEWRSSGHVFEMMAASRDASYSLTGSGDPETLFGYRFSSDFFRVLGVDPFLGRTFLPEEDRPGHDQVVVLSHRLWQRRFGGDPAVVGRAITLNGRPCTVIGVMPAGFSHPQGTELWTPLAMDAELAARRDARFLRVMARLAPGATIRQARAAMDATMRRLEKEHPDTNRGRTARVVSVREQYVGDIEPALLALLGAVGFVLLIACANVANLTLARSAGRRKEIAIRSALGAGRARIVRQLITEGLLLSALGGLLGTLLALWATGFLVAIFPNNIANLSIPQVTEVPLDARVLVFTLSITLLTGILFAVAPALRVARTDIDAALRETSQGPGGGRFQQRFLIVSEVALAVVLLAGAGLLIRSFARLKSVDMGLEPGHVLTEQVFLPRSRYDDAGKRRRFAEAVLQRISALPGIRSAGATNYLPLTGFWGTVGYSVEGQAPPAPGEAPEADNRVASPGYFRTMGIRLVKGRDFTDRDRENAPQVAIVNETLARRGWPGQDPIGRRIDLGDANQPRWCAIVGVVADVRSFGPDKEAHAEVFRPFAQAPFPLIAFAVRAESDASRLAAAVKEQIWATDREQPVFKIVTMEQLAAESLTVRRISTLTMTSLALLAMVLAAVGIYGVVSCFVSQRTREFGVRMALGAAHRDVLGLVMRQAMTLIASGMIVGLAASLALTRFLSAMLYGVEPTDPYTLLAVLPILTAAALAACWFPARRAARVDPMIALRYE